MNEIEPAPAAPAAPAVPPDVDYTAAAQRAWTAFTRKPVEIVLGMLVATLTAFLVVTAGAAALGMNHQALEAVRGRDVKIGTALAGYGNFVASLVALLLVTVAVLVGIVACIVPGLLAVFFFYWTFMCMADDPSLGAVGSLKRSLALVRAHPVPTLVVLLANFVLSLAGGMVAVGFIVTTPLGFLFGAAVFDQMLATTGMLVTTGPAPVVTPAPVPPPSQGRD